MGPLQQMTVNELKAELKKRDMPSAGLKAELVQRLQAALDAEQGNEGHADEEVLDYGDHEDYAEDRQDAAEAEQQEEDYQDEGSEDLPVDYGEGDYHEGAPVTEQLPTEDEEAQGDEDGEQVGSDHDDHGNGHVSDDDGLRADRQASQSLQHQQHQEQQEQQGQQGGAQPQPAQLPLHLQQGQPPQPPPRQQSKASQLSKDGSLPEWQQMDIPEDWMPRPLLRLAGMPEGTSEQAVAQLLQDAGVAVESVTLDPVPQTDGRMRALVRLPPLKLPWQLLAEDQQASTDRVAALQARLTEQQGPQAGAAEATSTAAAGTATKLPPFIDDGVKDGDAQKAAKFAVQWLTGGGKTLVLSGQQITVDAPVLQVCLFIGNVLVDDEAALKEELAAFGRLLRCFIPRNPAGQSKQYAIAEYGLPAGAAAAVKALDALCKEQQDAVYRGVLVTESTATDATTSDAAAKQLELQAEQQRLGGRQQIKLRRGEHCYPRTIGDIFATNLYVANMRRDVLDNEALRGPFVKFGPVAVAAISRNAATGTSRGFGFVEYYRSDHADAAFRNMDGRAVSGLGNRLIVSFVNPAKTTDKRSTPKTAAKAGGGAAGAASTARSGMGGGVAGGGRGQTFAVRGGGQAGMVMTGARGAGAAGQFGGRGQAAFARGGGRGGVMVAGAGGRGAAGMAGMMPMGMDPQMAMQMQRQMQMAWQMQLMQMQAMQQQMGMAGGSAGVAAGGQAGANAARRPQAGGVMTAAGRSQVGVASQLPGTQAPPRPPQAPFSQQGGVAGQAQGRGSFGTASGASGVVGGGRGGRGGVVGGRGPAAAAPGAAFAGAQRMGAMAQDGTAAGAMGAAAYSQAMGMGSQGMGGYTPQQLQAMQQMQLQMQQQMQLQMQQAALQGGAGRAGAYGARGAAAGAMAGGQQAAGQRAGSASGYYDDEEEEEQGGYQADAYGAGAGGYGMQASTAARPQASHQVGAAGGTQAGFGAAAGYGAAGAKSGSYGQVQQMQMMQQMQQQRQRPVAQQQQQPQQQYGGYDEEDEDTEMGGYGQSMGGYGAGTGYGGVMGYGAGTQQQQQQQQTGIKRQNPAMGGYGTGYGGGYGADPKRQRY